MLINKLNEYLDSMNMIGEEQAGFRKGYSTLDHIFVFKGLLEIYLLKLKGKKLYCTFIDYSKAFNTINRPALWSKLIKHNVNGRVLNVIYNTYTKAKSCIKINDSCMSDFECNQGVRQGENLLPLLFAIFYDITFFFTKSFNGLTMVFDFINEKLQTYDVCVFLKLYLLLYADDTIIMAESVTELQDCLNAVSDYCKLWS